SFGTSVNFAAFLKVPSALGLSATLDLGMTVRRVETPGGAGVKLRYYPWAAPGAGWGMPARKPTDGKRFFDFGTVFAGVSFGCATVPDPKIGYFLGVQPPGPLTYSVGFDMEAAAFNYLASRDPTNTPRVFADFQGQYATSGRALDAAVGILA